MSREFLLDSEVHGMVGALADIAGTDSDLSARRRMLPERIAGLIDADCWLWAMLGRAEPDQHPTFSVYLKGGFADGQFERYVQAQEHPDMIRLYAPLLSDFMRKPGHITRRRLQLDPENRFPESDVFALWKEADLGPMIFSLRPTSCGQASGVVFLRRFERDLFSERESRIAHIMLSKVDWFHDDAWPNHPREEMHALSPRLNTTTNLLLQGMTRKQIAEHMNLSLHTVNGYAKEIYARFGVHSQSELIRRFVEGDGGDRSMAEGGGI